MKNRKPAHEIRHGRFKATLRVKRRGARAFYSVTLARLVKEDGGWRTSRPFGTRWLERVGRLFDEIREWIRQHPADS